MSNPCLNDPSRAFKGTEHSPLGLGIHAEPEPLGATAQGRDGRRWVVGIRNAVKVWCLDKDFGGDPTPPAAADDTKDAPPPIETPAEAPPPPAASTKKVSVFNLYMRHRMKTLLEERPTMSGKERFAAAASEWKEMSPTEKKAAGEAALQD